MGFCTPHLIYCVLLIILCHDIPVEEVEVVTQPPMLIFNSYGSEICLYKTWKPKGFFNLKAS